MFMSCFDSHIAQERFSSIYDIDFDKPLVKSDVLCNVLNPLIVIHFLSVVEKIVSKGLKKDYMIKEENIHKVKGRVKLLENAPQIRKTDIELKFYTLYHGVQLISKGHFDQPSFPC